MLSIPWTDAPFFQQWTNIYRLIEKFSSSPTSPSSLLFHEDEIISQHGAQQGDPLGPRRFCLSIHPVVNAMTSKFAAFYLDDGAIGGNVDSVLDDLASLQKWVLRSAFSLISANVRLTFLVEPRKVETRHQKKIVRGRALNQSLGWW